MKEITVTNKQGDSITGKWNGKFYDSKYDGYCKIYINDEIVTISIEEKNKLVGTGKNDIALDIIANFKKLKKYDQIVLLRNLVSEIIVKDNDGKLDNILFSIEEIRQQM